LAKLLRNYPAISVEIDINYVLVDIVAERFDAGVRYGDQVAKDMIAVRISPDQKIAVVGTPQYLERRPAPATPHDLRSHECVNLRLPTRGGLYDWEFVEDGKPIQVSVRGQFILGNPNQLLKAALEGFGLAYIPEDLAVEHINAGRLKKVLEAYCPTFPGYHLYYPSRRQSSPGFVLIVEALRYTP
jgi:DNA-binding transcriptional LysR family regulator